MMASSKSLADTISEWRSRDAHSLQSSPYIRQERHMRIICIGAGPSGLCFAYKLQRSFRNFTLTVYEKNEQVGGTWYENKYPGCACNVLAHNYTWSFEPKPDFSQVYAKAPEIRGYFEDFKDKYELGKYCRTKHKVTHARWIEEEGIWQVQIVDLANNETFEAPCDILVNACGYLNAWKLPEIPGLEKFQRPILHSADWDETVDLSNKNVALIGNGASALQILPAIQPIVKKVTNFIRQPNWVAPGAKNRIYTGDELDEFARKPGALLDIRKGYEISMNSLFSLCIADSHIQSELRKRVSKTMNDTVLDGQLKNIMIPSWAVGCRRLTPGMEYLEALNAENTELVLGSIETTENACVCNGKTTPVDVLICATGFDPSFRPYFPVIGKAGQNLQDTWREDCKGYLGIAVPDFPNYFAFAGPNTPVSNGPVLIALEAQADHMLKICDRWQTENIHSFHPKVEAVRDFHAHVDGYMPKTIWTQECRSWFKGNSLDGRVSLWPGSTLHYIEAISDVRADDWNIRYKGNRFAWLGNGFSQVESDPAGDLAWYIRERDDGPYLSRGRQVEGRVKSRDVIPT